MDSLLQDLRYAIRVLARAPAFTAVTVITLGMGSGANATVFNFISALLLRPAPGVVDPRSLVAVYTADFSSGPYGTSSYPDFRSLAAEATAFAGMAAEQDEATGVVRMDDVVERVPMSSVTGEYFDVLGVRPHAGRLIGPADATPRAVPVAVLSYAFWQRTFGADPAILGRAVIVNGRLLTVIGIAPARFEGLDLGRATQLWTALPPPPETDEERGNRRLSIVGRLRPGATLAGAQTQVSTIAARLAERYPDTNRGILGAPDAPRPMRALRHTRLPAEFRSMVTTLGAILMTAVGLVLLIACANIASLLLSRATARDREMGIRLALGARTGHLIRQMLTESVLLGLAGGAVGLLCSLWTADLLPSFFPPEQARLLDTRVDSTTIAFILLLSLASSLLFGLAPAFHAARTAGHASLRSGSNPVSDSPGRTRLRRALVSVQVALAVVLLIAAALLTQSTVEGMKADPGFAARDGLVASVELPEAEFTPAQALLYYHAVLERVRRLPGVQSVSFVRGLPTSRLSRRGFRMEGYEPQPGEGTELHVNTIAEGYFETLRVPVQAGRTFDRRDRAGGAPVAIVNALLAERYFKNRALGRHLTDSTGRVMEIVGVVGNTVGLTVQSPAVPVVYYPLAQTPAWHMTLIARTEGDPLKLAGRVRQELQSVNRHVPVFRVMSLASHMAEASADSRLTAALVAVCGAMALLLATIGVYGVIAYAVARRQREIGVRLALGAQPRHIVHLVMSEGFTVTAAGIGAGLFAAALAARGLGSLLYGIAPFDPLTYVAVPIVLAIIVTVSACAPARRALRVEPNAVLRQE